MGTITTYENNGSSVSSITVTNVAPSGSNRVMYVATSHYPYTETISTVAFNASETVSLLDARNITSGSHPHRAEVWRLIAPSATTASVVVTFSGTVTAGAVMVICRDDTDQTTPNDTVAKGGNVGATSIALPPEFTWGGGDDVQMMCLSIRDSAGTATITADAGVTEVDRVGGAGARVILLTDQETETGKVLAAATTAVGYNVIWFNVNDTGTAAPTLDRVRLGQRALRAAATRRDLAAKRTAKAERRAALGVATFSAHPSQGTGSAPGLTGTAAAGRHPSSTFRRFRRRR